jgi:tetratricopeptide (TPR) repeat protein
MICRRSIGIAACRLAVGKLEGTADGAERLLLARVLSFRGFFNWKLGRTRFASQQLQRSLDLLGQLASDDQEVRLARAYALRESGNVASNADLEEARRLYEQSLGLFQELGDRYGTTLTLYALGEATRHLGLYEEARRFHQESLALRQAMGDRRGIADSLGGLSNAAVYQGQLEEGERLIRESIAICREIGNRAGIAAGLNDLGVALNYLGEYTEARTALEKCIALYDDLGMRNGLTLAYSRLALTELNLGWYGQARAHAQTCLSFAQETGYPLGVANGLAIQGTAALVEGTLAEAQRLLQEACVTYREIGLRDLLGWALALLGGAELAQGNIPQARQHFCEALQTAVDIRSFMTLLLVLPGIIGLLIVQGEQVRAVELHALVSRYPASANSRAIEDFSGRYVAVVAASLPPEVVTVAEERGQVRDLWDTAAELLVELGEGVNGLGTDKRTA